MKAHRREKVGPIYHPNLFTDQHQFVDRDRFDADAYRRYLTSLVGTQVEVIYDSYVFTDDGEELTIPVGRLVTFVGFWEDELDDITHCDVDFEGRRVVMVALDTLRRRGT